MALPKFGFVVEATTDTAKKGLAGLGESLDALAGKAKGLGQGLADAMKDINNVYGQERDELGRFVKQDPFGFLAMQEGAASLQDMGGQIQGLAGNYLDEASQLAGEFDGVFSQIAQKSGAADDELQAMRDKALELGATTQHSATGVASVMKDLAADGFGVADVLEGTDKVLNLATAGEMKAEEAGLYLSDIFAGFKPNLDPLMSTGQAFEYLSDQMATASDTTSLNVDQVAKTFLKFGPVAADAGVSFSDASALIGAVSPVAKAEEAGTALKSIITSARVASSKEVEGMWAEMGYSFDNFVDENGQADVLGILDYFRRAQLNADQVVAIFGKEFLPVANMLLSDEGFASAAELMESQMNAAGKTAEIAGVNMEGTAGATASLESAIEALKIKLGSAGLTDFAMGIDGIKTKAVQFVSNLPTPILSTIVAVLGLITAIGGLIAAVGTGLAGASTIGLLLPKIKSGLSILKAQAILPLITAVQTFFVTTLPTALATLPATIAGFLPVILPVLGIIIAIGLAALLIYKYWQPIKAFFQGFAEGFMSQMSILKTTITEAFSAAIEPLKELKPAFAQIKSAIGAISFAIFGEQLQTSGEGAKSWGKIVGEAVGFGVAVIANGLTAIIQGLGLFIRFGVALGEGFYTIYEQVNRFGVALGEGLFATWEKLQSFFGGSKLVFAQAKADFDTIVAVVQSWVTLVANGFDLARKQIGSAVGDAWAAISSYGTFVKEGFGLMFVRLGAWASDLYSLYIAPYVDPITKGILDGITAIGEIIDYVGSGFTQARASIDLHITKVRFVLESIFTTISSQFNLIVATIGYRFTQAQMAIGAGFTQAQTYVATRAAFLMNGAAMVFQSIGSFIATTFQTVVGAINTYIVQPYIAYVNWFWGGIASAFGVMWGAISGLFAAIGGFLQEQFAGAMGLLGELFGAIGQGVEAMWGIATDILAPAVEMFRSFVSALSSGFNSLKQAAANINPFGRGSSTVATKESRNNAENQALATGSAMGDVTATGAVDTATAAGATAAAVGNTTNANKSTSVSFGTINVNGANADPETIANMVLNEADRRVATAMQ